MKLAVSYLNDFSDEEYKKYYQIASPERRSTIDRYKSENDRRRSLLGEKLARGLISGHFSIPEEDIEFTRIGGKPYLVGLDAFISISHSKDMVICAIDDNEIGVDCERIRKIERRILKIACTDSDMEFIDSGDWVNNFFTLWTAKEAYFKFIGSGIIGLQRVNYRDIEPYCTTTREGDYIITVYQKRSFGD